MRRAVAVAGVVAVVAIFVVPSDKFGRFGTIASYQQDEAHRPDWLSGGPPGR